MLLADTTARFVAAPLDRCVAGATHLVWCAAPDLAGLTQWGVPGERDLHDLVTALDFIRHPSLTPACVLLDCRHIERVDLDMMMWFTAIVREWLPRWAPHIRRQAVIVPTGTTGLLLAGPLPLIGVSYPFRFVHDVADAVSFLEHPAAQAAYDEVTPHADRARGTAPLLARVRSALAGDLVGATVESVAATLAISTRTLQRSLRDAATSFTDELRAVRVSAAVDMLRTTDLKLDVIAARAGLGSASRMTAVLRRELGVTASQLRARPP